MAGRTKEERYLLRAYEMAMKSGELEHPLDRYLVGQSIGLSPKGIDAICQVLMRANFLRKGEIPAFITVTKRGQELALLLLGKG